MSDNVESASKVELTADIFYRYTDKQGNLLFQVIRKPGKKFIQRRPAKEGETDGQQQAKFHDGAWWIYSLAGVTPVPYRLHDLANSPNQFIVAICEGEKDAQNLQVRDKSVVATTLPGGANHKWQLEWTPYFAGRDVIICPDDDSPGHKHAHKIAAAILGAAGRVRIVNWKKLWPDKPACKKDVSDWLEAFPDERNVVDKLHAAAEDPLPQQFRDSTTGNRSKPLVANFDDAECAKYADQSDFELYWETDAGTNFVHRHKKTEGWSVWPEGKIKSKLRDRASYGNGIDDVQAERVLRYVMEHRIVDLQLSALSGYPIGLHKLHDGRRVLVRSQAQKIIPVQGDWSLIQQIINVKFNLSSLGHVDQTPWLYGWLKHAVETFYFCLPGDFPPGQALALVGTPGSGKSFLQNHIINPPLGNRAADPEPYLAGKTDFNSELFSAEHLKMEDPESDGTYKSRLRLGQGIKKLVANEIQRCHPKNRPAIMVKPFFRLTISINDSRESLAVLPALDPTVRGKLIVLKVADDMGPIPAQISERKSFCDDIESQMPAFVHFLLNEFQIPDALRCPRFAIREFIHPSVASQLFGRSPQAELLLYIDSARWGTEGQFTLWEQDNDTTSRKVNDGIWYGTQARLEDLLVSSSVGPKVERLLRKTKLGSLLSDLEEQTERVIHIHDADHWRWMICRP
jgi:hypothetical protein